MFLKYLRLWLVVALILLPSLYHRPDDAEAQDEKTWLLTQINNLRAQLNIHAYVWNAQLAAAAQQQSEYMASTGHISHQQSNGSVPRGRAVANGYNGNWIIENIYGGTNATATDAWRFWNNSSVHYAGLVNTNTNEIGIGVAQSQRGRFYTLVFGRGPINPPAAVEVPIDNPASVDTSNNDAGVSVQANMPPPTRRPPTRTFTPSPTIPTFTPTMTWTWTPEWTPSYTPTEAPPSATPLNLPTAAIVAQAIDTPLSSDTDNLDSIMVESQGEESMTQVRTQELAPETGSTFSIKDLLPIFIVGQLILIGAAFVTMMRRNRLG